MGKKQNKQLREQAVKRAEQYKEEQVQKLTAIKTASAALGEHHPVDVVLVQPANILADTVAVLDIQASGISINPATGRKLRVTGTPSAALSPSPGKTSPTPSKSTDTSVLAEKLASKKALVGSKKERHAPVSPSLRDDLERYKKKASAAHTSSPQRNTSYTITGNIAPEAIDFPVSPRTYTNGSIVTSTTSITGYRQTNAKPCVSHVASTASKSESTTKSGTKKSLSFDSFPAANPSFTFGSPLPSSPPRQDGWRLFLNLSAASTFSTTEPVKVKQGPVVDGHPGRSVFDAIADRARTEVVEIDSPSAGVFAEDNLESPQKPSLPCVVLAATSSQVSHDVVRQSCLTAPGDSITVALGAWVQAEVHQLQRSEAEYALDLKGISVQPDTTLTVYRPLVWKPYVEEEALEHARPTKEDTSPTWSSTRMFFIDPSGVARLVDFSRTLYDVNVDIDDGASDFDSIASPQKPNMRLLQPLADDETTNSEENSTDVSSDDFAEFEQYDCAFITRPSQNSGSATGYAPNISLSDDEDIIDPSLIFCIAEITKPVDTEDVTIAERIVSSNHAERKVCEEFTIFDEQIMLSNTLAEYHDPTNEDHQGSIIKNTTMEILCDLVPPLPVEKLTKLTEVSNMVGDSNCAVAEPSPTTPIAEEKSSLAAGDNIVRGQLRAASVNMVDMHTLISICKDADVQPKGDATITEEMNGLAHRPAFPSNWAKELSRMTLGTESLFTFFDHLETTDNNVTSKPAIVAAFLKLVNIERTKLSDHQLPLSYTVKSVMSSKIVPHTIFLGTTSLATFLAHFSFGLRDETTVDEVYRVFRAVSQVDMVLQLKATTGIMGALGVRQGRLAVTTMF